MQNKIIFNFWLVGTLMGFVGALFLCIGLLGCDEQVKQPVKVKEFRFDTPHLYYFHDPVADVCFAAQDVEGWRIMSNELFGVPCSDKVLKAIEDQKRQ